MTKFTVTVTIETDIEIDIDHASHICEEMVIMTKESFGVIRSISLSDSISVVK